MLLMKIYEGVDYMCNEAKKDGCTCIAEILKVILILQRKAGGGDTCLETCDRSFLGDSPACFEYNTRPIMLYTACGNGTPWEMPIARNGTTCEEPEPGQTVCSNVFRIEKLDGCCATFRVLAPSINGCFPYLATNSFFTMDLSCCCAIRCLPDTFVEGL